MDSFRLGSLMKDHPKFGFFSTPFVAQIPAVCLTVYSWGFDLKVKRLPYIVGVWRTTDGPALYASHDATPGRIVLLPLALGRRGD